MVTDLLQEKFRAMSKQVSRLLHYETPAYTQNDYDLSDSKERFLAQYKELRARPLQPDNMPSASGKSLSTGKVSTI